MTPFDFLKTINETKVNLLKQDPQNIDGYLPFIVNRGLSLFHDTIMYANEMNKYPSLSKEMQYDFYLNAIPKRKRWSKWEKKDKETEVEQMIMKHYKVSNVRAQEIIKTLGAEHVKVIITRMNDKGGK